MTKSRTDILYINTYVPSHVFIMLFPLLRSQITIYETRSCLKVRGRCFCYLAATV